MSHWAGSRIRRALFVDDQPEVARTLSKLLRRTGIQISFCTNGDDALRRLQESTYDIVLLDLHMPPGNWGGLRFLERLQETGLHANVLVLSGQGGQAETIKAIRLGARDFVIKDDAMEQLVPRVEAALEADAIDRIAYATDNLAAPLAAGFARLTHQREPLPQLRAGLLLAENAIRFSGIVALALSQNVLTSDQLQQLSRPSMGTWEAVCRQALGAVDDAVARRWLTAASGLAPLISVRNELAHGGEVGQSWVAGRLAKTLECLDQFVLSMRSLPLAEVVVPTAAQFTGAAFETQMTVLSGSRSTYPVRSAPIPTALISGRVYIRVGEGGYACLWPLVIAEPDDAPGAWQYHLWDGIERNRDRSLRYLRSNGERFISSTLSQADLQSPGKV